MVRTSDNIQLVLVGLKFNNWKKTRVIESKAGNIIRHKIIKSFLCYGDKILSHQHIIKFLKHKWRENGGYSLMCSSGLLFFMEFIFSPNHSGLLLYLIFKMFIFKTKVLEKILCSEAFSNRKGYKRVYGLSFLREIWDEENLPFYQKSWRKTGLEAGYWALSVNDLTRSSNQIFQWFCDF